MEEANEIPEEPGVVDKNLGNVELGEQINEIDGLLGELDVVVELNPFVQANVVRQPGEVEEEVGSVDDREKDGKVYIERHELLRMIEDTGGETMKEEVRLILYDLAHSGYYWDDDVLPYWVDKSDSEDSKWNENKEEMEAEFESVRDMHRSEPEFYEKFNFDQFQDEDEGNDPNYDPLIDWEDQRSIGSSDDEFEAYERKKLIKQVEAQEGDEVEGRDNPPAFFVGQKFPSSKPIKDQIKQTSLTNRRQVRLKYNDKSRIRAVCEGSSDCPWSVHASKCSDKTSWQIKTYVDKHRCNTAHVNRFAITQWLAKQYMNSFRKTPEWSVQTFIDTVMEDFGVEVSKHKVWRAKRIAEQLIHGTFKGQYRMLRDYCNEILTEMPGSTVKIDLEEPTDDIEGRRFKRVYFCLEPLKAGFAAGCRKLIGLDGAFIKGPYPGQLLTAVAIDPNNRIYPVAYAMVEIENLDSWKWFIELLADDLKIENQFNWTIISDEQKGLVPAVEEILPHVEHRFCLFHMYKNYKKQFKGEELKELLFKLGTAYSLGRFQHLMDDFEKSNKEAFDWVSGHPPKHWARSHFSTDIKCDILYNNLCECLNSKLVPVRDKPLISLLEGVRNYCMKRICEVRLKIGKCQGPLCPEIQKNFEKAKALASDYSCTWNGATKYQLRRPFTDQCHCDLEAKTCSCRRWDLTGIPCKHAIAAIYQHGKYGGNPKAEDWVDDCYKLETWKKVYSHTVNPINGPRMWQHQKGMIEILPPYWQAQPGRPRKEKKKDKDEAVRSSDPSRLNKNGSKIHRSLCGEQGHNRRRCKGEGNVKRPAMVHRQLGRRKLNAVNEGEASEPHHAANTNEGTQGEPNDSQPEVPLVRKRKRGKPTEIDQAPLPEASLPQDPTPDAPLPQPTDEAVPKGKKRREGKEPMVAVTQDETNPVDVENYVLVNEGKAVRKPPSRRMLRNGKLLYPLPIPEKKKPKGK